MAEAPLAEAVAIRVVVRQEAVDLRLPWIHPVWTSGDYGVVRSMKECRDENQASYGTNIGYVGWQPTAGRVVVAQCSIGLQRLPRQQHFSQ